MLTDDVIVPIYCEYKWMKVTRGSGRLTDIKTTRLAHYTADKQMDVARNDGLKQNS